LESRVKLQNVLNGSNQYPQLDTHADILNDLKENPNVKEAKMTQKVLNELLNANEKFLNTSIIDPVDQDIHKENFIKFLSESRDWAYDYIEMSQTTIKEVIDELNKKNIKESTNKLMALLPQVPNE
jgi:hypothetical protein